MSSGGTTGGTAGRIPGPRAESQAVTGIGATHREPGDDANHAPVGDGEPEELERNEPEEPEELERNEPEEPEELEGHEPEEPEELEGHEDGEPEEPEEPEGNEPEPGEPEEPEEPEGNEPEPGEPEEPEEPEGNEPEPGEPEEPEEPEGNGDEKPEEPVEPEENEDEALASALPGPPPDPSDAARHRLLQALAPRATRGQLLAAVVCALLGFAVVVQARQAQVQSLASLRESDLVAVLDNVTQESARLDDQARSLQQVLDELRTSSDRAPAARQAAQDRLQVLGVLAGTLPAVGPGIELEIADPKLTVNATQMLETVQELRDAGAEAMQIGPVRVVASTALVDDPAGLLVDRTVVAPPYRLLAIGDPQTLAAALEIPGGVLEVLRGKGVGGVVRTHDSLTITALRAPRAPQYARPAPAASAAR